MTKNYKTNSAEETEEVGRSLASMLQQRGITGGVIAMLGEMGVGKTAFIRGFASSFGIRSVKSPTYTVVNEYRTEDKTLYHFDMYRIESEDDLFSIGFEDYIAKEDAFSLIEWSENIREYLPAGTVFVKLVRTDDGTGREIAITIAES